MHAHIIYTDSPGDLSKYFPPVEYNKRIQRESSIAGKLSGNIKLTGALFVMPNPILKIRQELGCTL